MYRDNDISATKYGNNKYNPISLEVICSQILIPISVFFLCIKMLCVLYKFVFSHVTIVFKNF